MGDPTPEPPRLPVLHVTNGDCAADPIRRSGLPGSVVAWRDVLHDGPVPADLAPDALARLRARFIAACGWGGHEEVLSGFRERDAALAAATGEVVLWFEHDLYDQLQLLQVLDRLGRGGPGAARRTLICIGAHPEVEPFVGLGQLSPEQIAGLFPLRSAVTDAQVDLATRAWAAFRAPDPAALECLLHEGTTALRFLGGALARHLEEYPWTRDGLSRTERQALEALAGGALRPAQIFAASQRREGRIYMGDLSFWLRLRWLAASPGPLLAPADGGPFVAHPEDPETFAARPLALTAQGREVLEGRADAIALRGRIDRWLGGVHLRGTETPWRWDGERRRLVRTPASSTT